jgi:ParB family transcriptional regulator, chromosome partitioning protein
MATAAKQKVQDDDGKRLIGPAVISGALAEQVIEVMAEAARMASPPPETPAGAPMTSLREAGERMPRMVFLSQLKLCEGNVRRGSKGDLDQLAADIAAHGLLQNLMGVEDADGAVKIIAGGRRLRAMQQLVKRKVWDADRMVPVIVLEAGEVAREAGLAENFQRLALSPADEARAFAEVVAGGASDEDVARRFGVTVRHVRQRLRLAGLAPVVLEALAKGKITLDVAQAFASVPDAERQAAVFAGLSGWELGSADSVRRRMQATGTEGGEGLALFVGREAYLAAGGRIEADLFAEADDELWLDTELLEDLARPRLEAEAARLRVQHGFGRVEVSLTRSIYHFGEELGAERTGLPFGTDYTQLPAEQRARVLIGVEIGDDGRVEFTRAAMFLPADGSAVAVPAKVERAAAADDDAGDDVEKPEVFGGGAPTGGAAEKGLSGALQDALAMRRRDALALALLQPDNTGEASALLVFLALEAVMNKGAGDQRGSSIAGAYNDRAEPVTENPLPWAGDALDIALQKARVEGVDLGWLEGRLPVDRWRVFREQPVEQIERWAAVAAALSLKAWGENNGRSEAAVHRVVGQTIGADDVARANWRPTAAGYFDRAGKAGCMVFLEEVFGAKDGPEPWGKLKKAELSPLCERLAAGDATDVCALLQAPADNTLVRKIVGRAKAWLPKEMMWGGQ